MDALPPVFSDELYRALELAARNMWSRHSQIQKGEIPDRDTLRILFETAFFLSLRNEESRSVSLRLTYLESGFLEDREKRGAVVAALVFGQTVAYSVEELVKLAPSHDPRTSSFIVVRESDGLKVAGLLQFGPNFAPMAQVHRYPPPMGFGILTRGAGRLSITCGPFLIGRFEDGRFKQPEPTALSVSSGLGKVFYQTALVQTWHEGDRTKFANLYLKSIEEILYGMGARGHGGIILWLPKTIVSAAEKNMKIRRRVSGASHSGVDHIARLMDATGGVEQQLLSRLRQYLGMLAQLSCVDGALVVDENLRPLGYSVEIIAPTWEGKVSNRAFTEKSPVELRRFGMRHNSAANFAGAVVGSVALVVSQDGPARAMLRDGDELAWWPDCTSSIFV